MSQVPHDSERSNVVISVRSVDEVTHNSNRMRNIRACDTVVDELTDEVSSEQHQ